MSTDDDDLDAVGPGWQPDPEREGYERWFDGIALVGRAHREPDPFSVFSPAVARSLRPGPNRDARLARAGIALTILGFIVQIVAASGLVRITSIDEPTQLVLGLVVAALTAVITAVFAIRAQRRAARLGGRGIASVALGVSIVLGLAPVLLLVAIVLAGGTTPVG